MKRFIKIFTVLALLTCTFSAPVDAAAADYRYSRVRTLVNEGSRYASRAESYQNEAEKYFREADRMQREADRYRRQ